MALPEHQIGEMSGLENAREQTRRVIAIGAVLGFFIIILLIILGGWMFMRVTADEVLKVLATTAGVLAGVVGAIVGFYFRSEN